MSFGITKNLRRLLPSGMLMLAFSMAQAQAVDRPPADPKDYTTRTDFTLSWAKQLRGFQGVEDLQHAAGSKETIRERSLEGPDPYVSYHWRSKPPRKDNVGYMLATVRPNGNINVSVMTTGNQEVIFDNKGSFVVVPPGR